MKKLIINIAVAATVLINSSVLVAQLVSTPLEAGMFTHLKEMSSPQSYSVTLVDDNRLMMVLPSGSVNASIEYLTSDNIVITGTVAQLVIQNEGVLRDLQRKIDDYNFSAPLGTLKLDPASGMLTLEHRMNPKNVGPAAMASVAVKFLSVLARLEQRFTEKLA